MHVGYVLTDFKVTNFLCCNLTPELSCWYFLPDIEAHLAGCIISGAIVSEAARIKFYFCSVLAFLWSCLRAFHIIPWPFGIGHIFTCLCRPHIRSYHHHSCILWCHTNSAQDFNIHSFLMDNAVAGLYSLLDYLWFTRMLIDYFSSAHSKC